MKYNEPTLKITRFYEVVKTDGDTPMATLAPISATYNEATLSLTERFEQAAVNAANVLVYKWE